VRRVLILTSLAAVAAVAAIAQPASAQTAASCRHYINAYGNKPPSGLFSQFATRCLINQQRTSNRLPQLKNSGQLGKSALHHAAASGAAKSWDPNNGLVSHLDPGTPVPGDPNQLQQLVNQQIDARIRGIGFCSAGSSYTDGEITYGGTGTGATPRAAVNWWMSDPPHRAAVLSPQFRQFGVAAFHRSAFPGQPDATSGTYVVDLGSCTA
jgi:uncharacterized protein YkwD